MFLTVHSSLLLKKFQKSKKINLISIFILKAFLISIFIDCVKFYCDKWEKIAIFSQHDKNFKDFENFYNNILKKNINFESSYII